MILGATLTPFQTLFRLDGSRFTLESMAGKKNVESLLSIDGLETEACITPDGTFRLISAMDTNGGLAEVWIVEIMLHGFENCNDVKARASGADIMKEMKNDTLFIYFVGSEAPKDSGTFRNRGIPWSIFGLKVLLELVSKIKGSTASALLLRRLSSAFSMHQIRLLPPSIHPSRSYSHFDSFASILGKSIII